MTKQDQYHSPYVARLIQGATGLSQGFPHLSSYLTEPEYGFRGLTMFLGDTADVVVGLRIFGDDGTPMVMWSSGDDALMALINLDKAVRNSDFKVDKKAAGVSSSPPPK